VELQDETPATGEQTVERPVVAEPAPVLDAEAPAPAPAVEGIDVVVPSTEPPPPEPEPEAEVAPEPEAPEPLPSGGAFAPASETLAPPAFTPSVHENGEGIPPAASTAPARPELALAGAFAGGLVLAMILKRLAR
jgi:hypothetical protein